MSRIGNKPIAILDGVKVNVDGQTVAVEGPKGKLSTDFRPEVNIEVDGDNVKVSRYKDDSNSKALHGLTRALINNMVIGVKDGYEKKLELQGVGYVASVQGNQLSLRVGYANELKCLIPTGLDVTCPDQTHIDVKGCDKQLVGQFAAEVRSLRKPEPYKGKGIRYVGEYVKIKPGKAAT
ncbi:MAG: 50S ribosomal protein L6 [Mariniblastus sp.]|nr:50S ribosomal protein L6 [Mariniblastus sp.]